MRNIKVRRDFSEGDEFSLVFWGDAHRFNANCDRDKLERHRDELAEAENTLIVDMGDGADCIATSDKRYDSRHVDWDLIGPEDIGRLGNVVVEDRVAFIAPIIDKMIADIDGNHEKSFLKYTHNNVKLETLSRFGRSDLYVPGLAMIEISFVDSHKHSCRVIVNAHHGTKVSKYKATLLNSLLVKMRHWDGVDIMARGHCHYKGVQSDSRVRMNGNFTRLKDRTVYAALSGGYLKTYMEDGHCYAKDADLDPIDIGYQKFTLRPSREGCEIIAEV